MAEGEVTRRLTTIVAADVAGYSRLMAADEEGTLSALRAHRNELIDPKIGEYRGRIANTAGDSILIEFPSVVEALRCTLDFQRAIAERNRETPEDQRIEFRVGINVGDVMEQDGDLLGDGVNIAARLEGLAEPGGICISRTARDQVRDRMKIALEDMGEVEVKNIARPVRAFRVLPDGEAAKGPRKQVPTKWMFAAAAAVVLVLIAGSAAWWWQQSDLDPVHPAKMALMMHDRPSIAVLPFQNLSKEPTEDYLSDGVTEDIIYALGRYKSLAVMAFNAVVPYRNQALDPGKIGRSLGVKYILEGSVRRAGQTVRVSVRLTDANSGILVWSEQFDGQKEDVFAVQDAITRRIAGTLITNLRQEELKRASTKPTSSLDAYDFVLNGRAQLRRPSRRSNREARQMFERAIELDPNYAAAYAWLGRAHYLMATDGWTEFPAEALKRAEDFASKAITLDQNLVEAHRMLGRVYAIQFQLDRAITETDQAVALNPSDAEAYGDRGLILVWAGRLEEAITSLETAFTYDPNLRGDYVFAHGLALYSLRRHEDAIRVLERGAARYSSYVFIPAVLVAAYGQIDQGDEAKRNADKVKRLLPFFDAEVFGARFQDKKLYDYLSEGLQKGGLL